MHSSRQGINSGRIRSVQDIPGYSGIFRHIQAYSGIIQAYLEPCITLANSEF